MFRTRKARLIGLVVSLVLIAAIVVPLCVVRKSPQESVVQELVVGVGAAAGMTDKFTADPYKSPAMNVLGPLLYDPLVTVDRNRTDPALAISWDVSEDGKVWTFHLRQGVKFHDGSEFDAQTAKFSLNKATEAIEKSGMMGKLPPYTPQIESVDTVEGDKYTIKVHLGRPCGAFLENLSMFYLIVSPQSYSPEGEFTNPIGTGPFTLTDYSEREVKLQAFKDCWRGAPKLDRVVIRLIPNASNLANALEAGELDMVAGGGGGMGILYSDAKRFEDNPQFTICRGTSALLEFICFNSTRSPFNDIRVRQAVNYALNRQAIAETVFEGYAIPCKGPIGYDPSIAWTDPSIEGYPYNPEMARELLKEVEWQAGNTVTLTYGAFYPYDKTVAEMIQNQLKQVGINVKLQQLEMTAFNTLLMQGSYDFALQPPMGKGEVNPDPYLNMFFYSEGLFTTMRNETFDQAFDKVIITTDHEQRQQLYYEMQQIIMEQCPAAFLLHPAEGAVMRKEVKGFEMAYAFEILRSLRDEVYLEG